MSIRQFKLMGGTSDLDLTVKGGTFLSSPQGLGASRNASFVQVGNSFALAENKTKQGEISCEMIFANYTQYRTFISYCSRDNLVFAYKTPIDTDWFYREVVLVSCDKGEIGDGNVLHCATKFVCKTNWYKDIVYTQSTAVSGGRNFYINNHGDVDAGFHLHFLGNEGVVNSVWIGAGLDTINVVSNPFGTSTTYDNYYYHLNTIDTHARLYRENPLLDPVDTVDMVPDYTQNCFCKIPQTSENITVGITYTGGSSALTPTLEVREEYLSV